MSGSLLAFNPLLWGPMASLYAVFNYYENRDNGFKDPSTYTGNYGPGRGLVRGPCPVLNAMANHRYIDGFGTEVRTYQLEDELYDKLGIGRDLTELLISEANVTGMMETRPLKVHGQEYVTTFDLDFNGGPIHVEHDASFTRDDFNFSADAMTKNDTLVDQFLGFASNGLYFTEEDIARARIARFEDSKQRNPEANLTGFSFHAAMREQALLELVLGKPVRKSWAEMLLKKEKLPYELGWRPKRRSRNGEDVAFVRKRQEEYTQLHMKLTAEQE